MILCFRVPPDMHRGIRRHMRAFKVNQSQAVRDLIARGLDIVPSEQSAGFRAGMAAAQHKLRAALNGALAQMED